MSDECIFCRIARKEVPTHPGTRTTTWSRSTTSARWRPVHVLIVPRSTWSPERRGQERRPLLGKALRLAAKIADERASPSRVPGRS